VFAPGGLVRNSKHGGISDVTYSVMKHLKSSGSRQVERVVLRINSGEKMFKAYMNRVVEELRSVMGGGYTVEEFGVGNSEWTGIVGRRT
jgi:hypothetical protein